MQSLIYLFAVFLLSAQLLYFTEIDLHPTIQYFDEYGSISWNEEKARLDNFFIYLQHNSEMQG